jgi:hypothetical protein
MLACSYPAPAPVPDPENAASVYNDAHAESIFGTFLVVEYLRNWIHMEFRRPHPTQTQSKRTPSHWILAKTELGSDLKKRPDANHPEPVGWDGTCPPPLRISTLSESSDAQTSCSKFRTPLRWKTPYDERSNHAPVAPHASANHRGQPSDWRPLVQEN